MKNSILIDTIRLDYSSTNVSDSAWVQLKASLGENVSAIDVWESGGHTIKLGYGPAGSEKDSVMIPPGGCAGLIKEVFNKGMRLAVKGVESSTTISSGQLIINLYR